MLFVSDIHFYFGDIVQANTKLQYFIRYCSSFMVFGELLLVDRYSLPP